MGEFASCPDHFRPGTPRDKSRVTVQGVVMNRILSALCLVPLIGCGEDINKVTGDLPEVIRPDIEVSDTSTETDSNGSSDGGGDTDTTDPSTISPCTGVNTNVTVTTPNPNPSCDPGEIDRGPFGFVTYPWGGRTIGGKAYTCNKCPGGIRDFQGKWRAHGFTSDGEIDYSLGAVAGSDDAELLFIDGNTFYSRIYDLQEDKTVELHGWFFCGQQPEQADEHLFWVVLDATPDGTWGYTAGTIFESDVILSWANDRKLITWFDDLGANTSADIGYCQIGTAAGGQLCNDPFDP